MAKGKVYIGTSGWHYKHWIGTFYPEKTPQKEYMNYYLNFFRTAEINNSFYMMPKEQTFLSWKNAVPDDFVYAVKASRFITHMKKLKDPHEPLSNLLSRVDLLEEKLGPILFQLPPNWKINTERFETFIKALPSGYRFTVEFRNHTWYDERIYDLLREKNISFCLYELEGHLSPIKVTADWVYIRLHGPGGKYQGSYDNETLEKWARTIKDWNEKGKDVYVYFDNDQLGYAAHNAKSLKELINKVKPKKEAILH